MSDDAESSAEAQRETPDEPEMGAASTTVAPDRDAGRLVTAFVWVMRYGVHLAVAGSLLLVGLVLVFDVRVPRSLQIIGLTAGLSAVIAGRWVGGQAVDLMGGPQMMWLVDVDLLDRDGAGVYTCPTPRWSEWTVVDGQLWWATPNLAFGRGVDLDAREVAGTWVGSLPDPVLARALEYLRYNRKQLEPKARKGESLEINSFAIVRAAAVKTVKHVVRTFEKGALPDDGDALHAEIDSVLEDFDLDGSDSIFDEDPTEWAPGDGDPAPDPLADLDQRRKQHAANGESE
ncbi:hypothetical protein [Haloferax volcanii]|uniref:DUF8125 domain-containing protein n=3 Tax=Haloferax volcanii TaxID=2246 RepID=D4GY20_HALVD|nr:hypothetical protein [Haloferax volcanii]ADE03312.1 hypothetical protein HVO_1428 [Haloferax volcanii DS2]MDW7539319.1 hypothetical protein [Haloferax volcanii]